MCTYEQFIKKNNKLIWSIVENKGRKYTSNTFHKFLLKYYDKEDIYQELLMKIYEVYDTFNSDSVTKLSTYFTTVCINHLYYIMQPYKAEKKMPMPITTIDLDIFEDEVDYEKKYINELTLDEVYEYVDTLKYKDILKALIDGETQSSVAIRYELTRQRISQIWLEFLENIKGEIE